MNQNNNINQDEYYTILQKEFWMKWFSKLMFTLISVKLWGLIAGTWISTYLLLCHKVVAVGESSFELGINGTQWVTFNTTIWGLIFGMKEVFRVMDKKDRNEERLVKEDNRTREELAKINASVVQQTAGCSSTTPTYTSEGKEIVGSEPH